MAKKVRGKRAAQDEADGQNASGKKKAKKGVAAEVAGTEAAAEASTEPPEDEAPYVEDDDDNDDEEDDEPEEWHLQEEAEEEEADEDEEEDTALKPVWRPGIDKIEEGEQLDVEPGTYDMLHRAQVQWPCLSFDVVRDDLGAQRTAYPMTAYVVAGSQADRSGECHIHMMKWSRLHKTLKDDVEDSDDGNVESDDDDDDEDNRDAVLALKSVSHPGGVNRIRAMPQAGHIVATWADTGKVHVWNLEAQRKALDTPNDRFSTAAKPICTCLDHKDEGYALDFHPHSTGKLLSGGNDGKILLWEPVRGGWKIDKESPFLGHVSSVEDVQWKRSGNGCEQVFASASSDKSVRIWDCREQSRSKAAVCITEAHPCDVNVLSWSPCVGELLVTGADDGGFKIWDTRSVGAGPMANFLWHKSQVTSVDWHPTDETVLAVACADDSVSLWDMAVEDDAVGQEQAPGTDFYPPQLLFLHQGQKEPKEVKWHPQLPGVCISTAASGFNIFKTCNI